MADTKISSLTELTVPPDPTDELVVVDKSDTSMAASGTDKRIQYSNLYDWAESGDLSVIEPDDAAAAGSSIEHARADHQHAVACATASAITGTAAEGSATSFARSDHDHSVADALITSRLFKPTFGIARASATLTPLTTTYQDITGCSVTFSPATASTAIVLGVFDFLNTGTTSTSLANMNGQLDVDGSGQTGVAIFQYTVVGASSVPIGRCTASNIWTVNLTAASHTLKLQAKIVATATGTPSCNINQTALFYLVVSQ